MTLGTLGRPCLDEWRQTGTIALRASRPSGNQDGQLDIQIANGPELAPEDPESAELIAHDRLLERAPEYPPRGADPARRDTHGMDLFWVLAGDRPRDAGEHARQVDPENLPASVGPTIGAGDFGHARRRQMLEGDIGSSRPDTGSGSDPVSGTRSSNNAGTCSVGSTPCSVTVLLIVAVVRSTADG